MDDECRRPEQLKFEFFAMYELCAADQIIPDFILVEEVVKNGIIPAQILVHRPDGIG
jgi:hypothetical protein